MTDRLAIGTVVRLKSGGPDMTVVKQSMGSSSSHPSLECAWFGSEPGETRFFEGAPILTGARTSWFAEAALELAK